MSKTNLVIIAGIFIILSISCSRFMPGGSNTAKAPAVDFASPGKPLDVKVLLDKKQTASGTISAGGGSLSLTAADGSTFKLDVPAKAVNADTIITMTAVKSIDGAPMDNNAPTAVQLEPSGLFFKEVATLTIVPGKEIPLKQQVVFGYEGEGKDYHLAVVDPKSKEIRIKLMQFSGAGVGTRSDASWAANLAVQAGDARARLMQKLGEATQGDRLDNLLGGDSNQAGAMIESFFEQFYDQVVLKEMAAAELDCKHAQKALDDLIFLERLRQLLGGSDSSHIATPGFAEKAQRLGEIGAKCSTSYTASGTSGPVTFSGQICSLDKPFVIDGKFANGSETQSFTPAGSKSGTVQESGNSGGCTQTGGGTYKVTLTDQGPGILEFTETVTGSCPPYSRTKTMTFRVTLTPASGLSCP